MTSMPRPATVWRVAPSWIELNDVVNRMRNRPTATSTSRVAVKGTSADAAAPSSRLNAAVIAKTNTAVKNPKACHTAG
jgi:hypothetical protein